ncbi:hypothetical protein BST61_g11593 [Cercospora zeina]
MASAFTYSAVPVKEEAQVHETDLRLVHEDAAQVSSPQRRWKTWKTGVAASASLCCAVLLTNLALTVVAVLRFSGSMTAGIGTLFQGSCESVDSWSTGLHVIINVLSSAMLSASSYTMQSLTAPTRAEVNKAQTTIPLCLGGLIAAAVYLAKGLDWQGSGTRTRGTLSSSDFGRLNPNSIIGSGPAQRGFKGLIGCIILAN